MGQMIDEEECEVCIPFDQEWIFTYGDLVTLLLCFFILLFSMCRTDVEKSKQIAQRQQNLMNQQRFQILSMNIEILKKVLIQAYL